MRSLNPICDAIREDLEQRNAARDQAIAQSRQLIRLCSLTIRAIHRGQWTAVDDHLANIQQAARALRKAVQPFPDLYHTGYTQDALKEVAEAFITNAIIRRLDLPSPAQLNIESATYLKGLAEAATELRRFILDIMRQNDSHSPQAEELLDAMDHIYDQLNAFDFPDALTHGLRRKTDIVRSVLERTRGDLTQSLRQQKLQDALLAFEDKISPRPSESDEQPPSQPLRPKSPRD